MESKTLKLWTCLFVLLVFASVNVTAVEKAGGIGPAIADVIVNNTYVEIAVDDSDSNYRSTFTMGTTGGDPTNANDNNKVLLYGHPSPWSSFTTIRVDGNDYSYGGSGMSMVTGATASTNSITSTWTVGNIIVTQTLTIVTSSTTGRADTVKIDHKITNNGSNSSEVGIRLMLDTMLGDNDGAPFNIPGTGAVTTEMEFTGASIPEYWQAFDDLSNPSVISQGTLTGGSATTPDTFMTAYWADIFYTAWNYTVSSSQTVTGDSAVALYWNPKTFTAGQISTYTTYYGLGKVTVASGNLTAGLTAPSTVSNCSNFTVVAYVTNVGGTTANDVAATISLSAGLMLLAGETSQKDMGSITNGSSNQSSWSVEPYGGVCGNMTVTVTVTSTNVDSNTVNVTVNVPEACCVTTTTTTTSTSTSSTTINATTSTTTTAPTTTTTISAEADAYEPDDTCALATTISTDGTKQQHNFVPSDDQDWVKFDAVSGIVYTIETSDLGVDLDTYIYFYGPGCVSLIDENDDHMGLESQIEWTATSSGTYYVKIEAYGGYVLSTLDTAYNVSVTGSSAVVNTSFFDNMESGANGWTATGFWHQETNPEHISIISGINPELVSLPDNGSLPSAYSGSTVWWYGEASTGTFIGSDYNSTICENGYDLDKVGTSDTTTTTTIYDYDYSYCQTAKNGGTSIAPNTGNLISPTIDLTGVSDASLTFMSWYEIEGVDIHLYDMMYVYISTDGGLTYTELGAINPINDLDGETFKPYSSGGLGLTGVWVSQHFDISSYTSSQTVIKFTFDTVDALFNGFRGWIIDDVMIGTTGAAITPTISVVAPSAGVTGTIVVITGTNFMNGASVKFGTTSATTVSVVSSSLIQVSVPTLADGTYDVTVINPNAEQATSSNAFTVTTAYPPAISSISPTSGTNDQSTAVTINGSNFENGATVEVGGTTLSSIVVVSSTSITATVPAGLSGGYKNVKVTNPDSQYDVLMGGFYVNYTTSIDQAAVTRDLPSTATAGGTFTATLELVLGDVPPNSVIIKDFAPVGWTVTSSSPTYNSFNSATGEVKWMMYVASLYAMNITYTVSVPSNATGTGTFTGELKYNDVDGNPVTQSIAGDTSITVSAEEGLKGDLDGDGVVSDFELLSYVDMWVQGTVTDFDLLEAIDNWVNSG